MAKYIVQKAVSPDKVKKGLLAPLNTYEQQAKYDGCCAVLKFGYGGEYRVGMSRTGECYVSLDRIGRDMQNHYGRAIANTVLIGEAWWPGMGQFNHISGEFRRGQESDLLRLMIHDAIPLADFEAGECLIPYTQRVAAWRSRADAWPSKRWQFVDSWLPGHADPQERCNQLTALGGFDGLILRKQDGIWRAGSGTTGEIIKIKRELSFDLEVKEVLTGVGPKTGRPVYSLVVDYMGRSLGVGSGLPHTLEDVPKVGDIVEVVAMDYSSDGLLREPRYKGIRHDKLEPDT